MKKIQNLIEYRRMAGIRDFFRFQAEKGVFVTVVMQTSLKEAWNGHTQATFYPAETAEVSIKNLLLEGDKVSHVIVEDDNSERKITRGELLAALKAPQADPIDRRHTQVTRTMKATGNFKKMHVKKSVKIHFSGC